jgi:hypothetical protein
VGGSLPPLVAILNTIKNTLMNILKTNGGYLISAIIGGYRVSKFYIGYGKRQALQLFRSEYGNI